VSSGRAEEPVCPEGKEEVGGDVVIDEVTNDRVFLLKRGAHLFRQGDFAGAANVFSHGAKRHPKEGNERSSVTNAAANDRPIFSRLLQQSRRVLPQSEPFARLLGRLLPNPGVIGRRFLRRSARERSQSQGLLQAWRRPNAAGFARTGSRRVQRCPLPRARLSISAAGSRRGSGGRGNGSRVTIEDDSLPSRGPSLSLCLSLSGRTLALRALQVLIIARREALRNYAQSESTKVNYVRRGKPNGTGNGRAIAFYGCLRIAKNEALSRNNTIKVT